MNARTFASAALVATALAVSAAVVWGEISVQDVRKIALVLRPYQVLSGQTATTNFEVIYVLDNDAKKLAVLEYDVMKKQLVPIAGRYLVKDFNSSEEGGPFSMVTTQLTNNTGLLYVTDAATHRALVYQVDLNNNKVTPQQPIDLKKLFND
jgi:hypothetical protein